MSGDMCVFPLPLRERIVFLSEPTWASLEKLGEGSFTTKPYYPSPRKRKFAQERSLTFSILSRKGRGKIALSLLVLLCMAAFPSHAQSPQNLTRVEKKLSQQKAQAATLDKKEKEAARDLDDLKKQLIAATAALQDKQDEQEQLEDKLATLEEKAANRSSTQSALRARLTIMTSALLRLSRQPPETFLFRTALADDRLHRAVLLRFLLPRLQADMVSLAREIDDLEVLHEEVSEQKRLVTAAAQNLQWQRANLDQLVQMRQGLLQKTAAQRAAIAQQLAALTNEAKDLRQLMEKVSHAQAFPKKGLSESSPSFRLKLPVSGRITHNYGTKDDYGVASQGVTLTAAPGSPVVAPRDGRVVFAGVFRGYGQILILQHDEGYHSFLAGFGRIDAEMGQTLAAGEPLGVLPTSGKPELYFEWRHNGEPVDPMVNSVSQRDAHR